MNLGMGIGTVGAIQIVDIPNSDPRAEPGVILDKSFPLEDDFKQCQKIKEMISKYFDHEEKKKQKELIIMRIQDVVNKWMLNINVNERKIPKEVAHMVIISFFSSILFKNFMKQLARILPFGSYYLGVSSIDGDIDLVCIAPSFVERNNHFNVQLFDMISKMEGITYENNVSDAKVPILQFEIEGIPIDISFAQLDVETLPVDIDKQIPDKHLLNMDERDKMSINGYRCNQAIMRYVTEYNSNNSIDYNKLRFQDSLKVIKIWARNNGIYENRLGYLGGISWALLLAKVCQMFPNAAVNVLIEQFFKQYSTWKWATMDVQLAPFSQADERLKSIKSEMYIYTPAYPEYNSTERVKRINLEIIDKKIKEANRLIQEEIKMNKCGWERLIQEEKFTEEYKQFIEIDLIRTKKDDTMREFKAQQDKLSVKLLTLFDIISTKKPNSLEIRPWPTFYRKKDNQYPQCSAFLVGVKAKEVLQNNSFSFKHCVIEFASQQQKSLEALANCMIRVFQTNKDNLNDLVFDEGTEGEQDYFEYEYNNNDNNNGTNQNASYNNGESQNINELNIKRHGLHYPDQLPYKQQRINSEDMYDEQSQQQSQSEQLQQQQQQGQISQQVLADVEEQEDDNLDDYM